MGMSRHRPDEMTDVPHLRRFWWWLNDLTLQSELWLFDRIAGPSPQTEADRIREYRMQRLRRAFPVIDIDGTGPWQRVRRA